MRERIPNNLSAPIIFTTILRPVEKEQSLAVKGKHHQRTWFRTTTPPEQNTQTKQGTKQRICCHHSTKKKRKKARGKNSKKTAERMAKWRKKETNQPWFMEFYKRAARKTMAFSKLKQCFTFLAKELCSTSHCLIRADIFLLDSHK